MIIHKPQLLESSESKWTQTFRTRERDPDRHKKLSTEIWKQYSIVLESDSRDTYRRKKP